MNALTFIHRAWQLVQLECGAFWYPRTLRRRSLRSVASRWWAVMRGKRHVQWLGVGYSFETRFEPILMHVHQKLILDMQSLGVLPTGARVLDIGANIGQFGTALKALRKDVRIVSLEPNPECRSLLEKNAGLHDEWVVVPHGLAEKDGDAMLWYVPGRSGQGSVYRQNASANMMGEVQAAAAVRSVSIDVVTGRTLRTLLSDGFDLVKVDVEGFEAEVLPEIAVFSWRYLCVELGGARAGAICEDEAASLLARCGAPVRIIGRVGSPDTTHDVVFERLDKPIIDQIGHGSDGGA